MALLLSSFGFSQETESTNLQETLDGKKAAFESRATDEKKRIYAEGITAVKTSGIISSALQVGDTAIDFKLKNF